MAPADPADVEAAHPDRTERDRGEDEARQPARPPAFFGLERGDRVFDFLTAGGYYSEPMARAVGPDGFVMAHNPPRLAGQSRVASLG